MSEVKEGLVGEELLGYELTELLGTWGSSEIYRASPVGLENRDVVVKIAKRDHPKYNKDLERLAKTLDAVDHPNVVDILNFGNYNGRNFLILEGCEQSFKDDMERWKIPNRQNYKPLAEFAVQVLRGLEAAHKENVLHEDLTPSNILLDKNGNAKLTDFFDPEVYSDEEESDDISSVRSVREQDKNNSDVVDARKRYLAPEQKGLVNSSIDERTDVYALGMILYEALMGEMPVGNYDKIKERHYNCPDWLEQAVDKALAGKPSKRFRSARAMKEHLEKGLEGKFDAPTPEEQVKNGFKKVGYVVSRPFVLAYDVAGEVCKFVSSPDFLIPAGIITGIGGLMALAVWGLSSISASIEKQEAALRSQTGIVAYVNDNKIVLAQPSDFTQQGNNFQPTTHETIATDLVGLRWRDDGQKILLVDEPKTKGLFSSGIEDTALYVFDMGTRVATKILDITDDSNYNAIKEAYWSKTNPNLVYVNLDLAWYTIDISQKNYPLQKAEGIDGNDINRESQKASKDGSIVAKIMQDGDIGFELLELESSKSTPVDAEDVAWYHDGLKERSSYSKAETPEKPAAPQKAVDADVK